MIWRGECGNPLPIHFLQIGRLYSSFPYQHHPPDVLQVRYDSEAGMSFTD